MAELGKGNSVEMQLTYCFYKHFHVISYKQKDTKDLSLLYLAYSRLGRTPIISVIGTQGSGAPSKVPGATSALWHE